MTLVLNTLGEDFTAQVKALLTRKEKELEIINTSTMKIAHCIGCNQCWLKTPGICSIKDDYEDIIKKMVGANNLWIVSDTQFGFFDHKGKRLIDRILPMLNIYIEFRDGYMRHQLRYHPLNVGVIYKGVGNQELIEEWADRASHHLNGHSLGVIDLDGGRKFEDYPAPKADTSFNDKNIVIINGSPRVQKFSNTDKIIQSFGKGLEASGLTYEVYSLSNQNEWESAREAFRTHQRTIIATPLYVESLPSLLIEFLETLPKERQQPAQLSFILHSGFEEGYQLRLGEKILQSLPAQLGCSYGGTLVHGGSFLIRLFEGKNREKIVKPYEAMGRQFAEQGTFLTPEAKKFTGPEGYPWLVRQFLKLMLKGIVHKHFNKFAHKWGCTRPLNDKVYEAAQ